MLPKKHRLRDFEGITSVLRTGHRKENAFFSVIKKNRPGAASRFSIIVSKKVHKSAVKRNRIRRRVRELLREEIVPTNKTGYDVIVRPKPQATDADWSTLREALKSIYSTEH